VGIDNKQNSYTLTSAPSPTIRDHHTSETLAIGSIMASPKQSSSKLPTIALPELPNLMNHLPSSLNNFAIPLIPAPPNNRFNEDPQAYAKEMKTKKGAPLSGQKDLLPASIVNRQKGNVDLMDAPARAAMSRSSPNRNILGNIDIECLYCDDRYAEW
jgi:hypothetical protein